MLTFIKRLFNQPNDAGPTQIAVIDPAANLTKMSFEDRKAWREEMLHRSIRETFESIGVISCMYKYTASQLDDRGHYFKIMIDITKDFSVNARTHVNGMSGIEELMAKNTFEKYGVVIRGIYWRTNDQINVFAPAKLGVRAKKQVHEVQQDFADTKPDTEIIDMRQKPRPEFDPISEDEAAAFSAALQAGTHPPVVHIGRKVYSTDLMPLETEL